MTTIDPKAMDTLLRQALRERAADTGDEDRFRDQVLAAATTLPQRKAVLGWPFSRRTTLVLVASMLAASIAAGAMAGAMGWFRRSMPMGNGPVLVTHEGTSWWMDPTTGDEVSAALPELPIGTQGAAWTRDGKQLAIVVAGDLALLDLVTGNRRVLASCEEIGWVCTLEPLLPPGSCVRPCWLERTRSFEWSPDATAIAIAEDPGVLVVDVASGAVTVLVSRTRGDLRTMMFSPSWSADGRWIAFELNDAALVGQGAVRQIHIIRRDGSDLHRLDVPMAPSSLGLTAPVWPPSGPGIIVPVSDNYGTAGPEGERLGFMALKVVDGNFVGPPVRLVDSGAVPCVGCLGFTFAPDGHTVLMDDGDRLYLADLRRPGISRLGTVNARPQAWRPVP